MKKICSIGSIFVWLLFCLGNANAATTDIKTSAKPTQYIPVYDPDVGAVSNPDAYGRYTIGDILENGWKDSVTPTVAVPTIADLRLIGGTSIRKTVMVLGYYAPGDGGGGPLRVWKESGIAGTYIDNGGSIIVPTAGDGSGAWVWQARALNIDWFGAKGDGITNDRPAMLAAIATISNGGLITGTPGKTYLVTAQTTAGAVSQISVGNEIEFNFSGCILYAPPLTNTSIVSSGNARFVGGTYDNVWLGWSGTTVTSGGVSGGRFVNQTYTAVTAINSASGVVIEKNYFEGEAHGDAGNANYATFQITTGAGNCVYRNNICKNVTEGVTVDGITDYVEQVSIYDNKFDGFLYYAAKVDVTTGFSFLRNTVIGVDGYSFDGVWIQILNESEAADSISGNNVIITGNTFRNLQHAVYNGAGADDSLSAHFDKNIIIDCRYGWARGLARGSISGNRMVRGESLVSPIGETTNAMRSDVLGNVLIANNDCRDQVNNTTDVIQDNQLQNIQGVIIVNNDPGSTWLSMSHVVIRNNTFRNYYGNAIMLPRTNTTAAGNAVIEENIFYDGLESTTHIKISAANDTTIRKNRSYPNSKSLQVEWLASTRVYGKTIYEDNSWQLVNSVPILGSAALGEVWSITPIAAGGYTGKICVTAGFTRDGVWTTDTPYVIGDIVTSSSKVYIAETAGTSGATQPAHTTGSVSDGGVVWRLIGFNVLQAVFKDYGSIGI